MIPLTFPRPAPWPLRAVAAMLSLALALVLGAHAPAAAAENDEAYAIGLWGDLPYSAQQESVGLPNLLADMNANDLRFSVHDGDLKAGSGSRCDDALYDRARGWFDSLRGAAMFTPGDNDWTDCDRPGNGGFDARERLDRERQVFFATPFSMGRQPIAQEVQTQALCLGQAGAVPCVENRRWTLGRVTYVTLNVPGSCNNLCDTAPDPAEFQARNAANIAWLRDSFAAAVRECAVAVMVISQANPGWDRSAPPARRCAIR